MSGFQELDESFIGKEEDTKVLLCKAAFQLIGPQHVLVPMAQEFIINALQNSGFASSCTVPSADVGVVQVLHENKGLDIKIDGLWQKEVQGLQEKRDVKSARTEATAVFLTPPEHMSIESVVMAIAQASRHELVILSLWDPLSPRICDLK
ncbi:hypothetical protein WISP_121205 [Willisornis vidua]|uniref:Uncharacterized protein n=1 Tax=Willisornis vidua TaxID=1566151 RepID=A0ABQ9CX59_9PASS|nr:hypothetical protein WISP_121205 [Willisornis vidua]